MGWDSEAHRGFPGKFESSNVSREIGRNHDGANEALRHVLAEVSSGSSAGFPTDSNDSANTIYI